MAAILRAGISQDNHSLSAKVGTLRGLHYQAPPHAQDKLVRCGRGRLFDVAVDIRRGSPTYGQWVGVELSARTASSFWSRRASCTASSRCEPDTREILYKCSDYYAPECDGAVRWDDPDSASTGAWPRRSAGAVGQGRAR